jgi:CRISPR system Cascade subunit CasB
MSLAITGAIEWWQDLQADPARKRPGDRAALARLRRCATIVETMQDPAALSLFRRCGGRSPDDLPLAGLAAGVLAHVRNTDPAQRSIARTIGPRSSDEPGTALLKPLRFRRLMEADTLDERLTAFRRLVALAGGTVNVRDLAVALLAWNETRRIRWIYDYWNAGQPTAAPQAEETSP